MPPKTSNPPKVPMLLQLRALGIYPPVIKRFLLSEASSLAAVPEILDLMSQDPENYMEPCALWVKRNFTKMIAFLDGINIDDVENKALVYKYFTVLDHKERHFMMVLYSNNFFHYSENMQELFDSIYKFLCKLHPDNSRDILIHQDHKGNNFIYYYSKHYCVTSNGMNNLLSMSQNKLDDVNNNNNNNNNNDLNHDNDDSDIFDNDFDDENVEHCDKKEK